MNGIVHPYYTVALAPAIAAWWVSAQHCCGRTVSQLPAATALSGIVLVSSILDVRAVGSDRRAGCPGSGASSRSGEWRRRRCCLSRAGCHAAAARSVACLASSRVSLAAPAAYSIATAATPHRGAIPSAGPSGHGVMPLGGRRPADRTHSGSRLGRRRWPPTPNVYTWAAAAVGLEQRGGLPIGQRRTGNGDRRFQRDRSGADAAGVPALRRRQEDPLLHPRTVDDRSVGRPPRRGSREAADIAEWVETHFAPTTVDRVDRLRPHPGAEELIAQT